MSTLPKCDNCGTQGSSPQSRFCSNCGTPFNPKDTPATRPTYSTTPASSEYSQKSPTTGPQSNQFGRPGVPPPYRPADPFRQPNQNVPFQPQQRQTEFKPLTTPIVNEKDGVVVIFFILVTLLAHILRHMLYFNEFPNYQEILFSAIVYLITLPILFFVMINAYREKGVKHEFETDRFDYMFSMVLSTFFISTLSFRFNINNEETVLPNQINFISYDPKRANYQTNEYQRAEYVGSVLKPKAYKNRLFFALGFGYLLYFISGIFDPVYARSIILTTGYFGFFTFLEIAPSIGRNRELITGKSRIIGFVLLILSILLILMSISAGALQQLQRAFF
jgi:hypothetical protein